MSGHENQFSIAAVADADGRGTGLRDATTRAKETRSASGGGWAGYGCLVVAVVAGVAVGIGIAVGLVVVARGVILAGIETTSLATCDETATPPAKKIANGARKTIDATQHTSGKKIVRQIESYAVAVYQSASIMRLNTLTPSEGIQHGVKAGGGPLTVPAGAMAWPSPATVAAVPLIVRSVGAADCADPSANLSADSAGKGSSTRPTRPAPATAAKADDRRIRGGRCQGVQTLLVPFASTAVDFVRGNPFTNVHIRTTNSFLWYSVDTAPVTRFDGQFSNLLIVGIVSSFERAPAVGLGVRCSPEIYGVRQRFWVSERPRGLQQSLRKPSCRRLFRDFFMSAFLRSNRRQRRQQNPSRRKDRRQRSPHQSRQDSRKPTHTTPTSNATTPADAFVIDVDVPAEFAAPIRTVIEWLSTLPATAAAVDEPQPTTPDFVRLVVWLSKRVSRPLVPVAEAVETLAEVVGGDAVVNADHVRRAVKAGWIRAVKCPRSGRWLVLRSDALAWAEARKNGELPTAKPTPTAPAFDGIDTAPKAANGNSSADTPNDVAPAIASTTTTPATATEAADSPDSAGLRFAIVNAVCSFEDTGTDESLRELRGQFIRLSSFESTADGLVNLVRWLAKLPRAAKIAEPASPRIENPIPEQGAPFERIALWISREMRRPLAMMADAVAGTRDSRKSPTSGRAPSKRGILAAIEAGTIRAVRGPEECAGVLVLEADLDAWANAMGSGKQPRESANEFPPLGIDARHSMPSPATADAPSKPALRPAEWASLTPPMSPLYRHMLSVSLWLRIQRPLTADELTHVPMPAAPVEGRKADRLSLAQRFEEIAQWVSHDMRAPLVSMKSARALFVSLCDGVRGIGRREIETAVEDGIVAAIRYPRPDANPLVFVPDVFDFAEALKAGKKPHRRPGFAPPNLALERTVLERRAVGEMLADIQNIVTAAENSTDELPADVARNLRLMLDDATGDDGVSRALFDVAHWLLHLPRSLKLRSANVPARGSSFDDFAVWLSRRLGRSLVTMADAVAMALAINAPRDVERTASPDAIRAAVEAGQIRAIRGDAPLSKLLILEADFIVWASAITNHQPPSLAPAPFPPAAFDARTAPAELVVPLPANARMALDAASELETAIRHSEAKPAADVKAKAVALIEAVRRVFTGRAG